MSAPVSQAISPARKTHCLCYDGDAAAAARFYANTFPDSSVGALLWASADFPAVRQRDVLTVSFTILGIPCLGLNGGSAVRPNEALSFQFATVDQAETDRDWHASVDNGGQESARGWCRDRGGYPSKSRRSR
jgi:2-polyprenyl-6-hydroxyphenyl methylase/3-demethylubiquinone-9 3-methyltransferase